MRQKTWSRKRKPGEGKERPKRGGRERNSTDDIGGRREVNADENTGESVGIPITDEGKVADEKRAFDHTVPENRRMRALGLGGITHDTCG